MKKYSEMSPEELASEKEQLRKEYVKWQAKGLKLDMSRGKPSVEQLNLSMPLFDILDGKSLMKCMNGVETSSACFQILTEQLQGTKNGLGDGMWQRR